MAQVVHILLKKSDQLSMCRLPRFNDGQEAELIKLAGADLRAQDPDDLKMRFEFWVQQQLDSAGKHRKPRRRTKRARPEVEIDRQPATRAEAGALLAEELRQFELRT